MQCKDGSSTSTPYGQHLVSFAALAPRDDVSLPLLPSVEISIACDVKNPFVGPQGAVYVCIFSLFDVILTSLFNVCILALQCMYILVLRGRRMIASEKFLEPWRLHYC